MKTIVLKLSIFLVTLIPLAFIQALPSAYFAPKDVTVPIVYTQYSGWPFAAFESAKTVFPKGKSSKTRRLRNFGLPILTNCLVCLLLGSSLFLCICMAQKKKPQFGLKQMFLATSLCVIPISYFQYENQIFPLFFKQPHFRFTAFHWPCTETPPMLVVIVAIYLSAVSLIAVKGLTVLFRTLGEKIRGNIAMNEKTRL